MNVLVLNQTSPGETRVPAIPAVVEKWVGLGFTVTVEPGAGLLAHHDDAAYEQAGGKIANATSLAESDVIVTIHPPTLEQVSQIKQHAILIGSLAPLKHLDIIKALADRQVTSFSAEFIPRISRAQPMDVLSSQANLAGYQAVIMAANISSKIFPMLMTAAGTIAPSKVLVIGAGVAGLQAIATAKRLGAVVEAYDVRPVVKEQVQSLGARFVELPIDRSDSQTAGGYAKEQTDEQRQKQADLMAKHVIRADVVITTAAIFGKAPPLLIDNDVVGQMHRGSVIVDMAADVEAGRGNCQATQPNQNFVTDNGVTILGHTNLPALVPIHASQAYANNMHSFLSELLVDGKLQVNLEDDIQSGACITHDGKIKNELISQSLANV